MHALKSFITGFTDFKKTFHSGQDSLYTSLHRGQNPGALVIACCDSRVDPALLLGCGPGDIFVIRNIANLVPHITSTSLRDATIAALNYGVLHLQIRHIVVLGHSNCGGINAVCALQRHRVSSPLEHWLDMARPALELTRKRFPGFSQTDMVRACHKISLLLSMDNLLSWPWIRKLVEQGMLKLHPWFFDMERGELLCFNRKNKRFELLRHQATGNMPDMDYGAASFYSQLHHQAAGSTVPT